MIEVYAQWIDKDRDTKELYFVHIKKDFSYKFNHWGESEPYAPASDDISLRHYNKKYIPFRLEIVF